MTNVNVYGTGNASGIDIGFLEGIIDKLAKSFDIPAAASDATDAVPRTNTTDFLLRMSKLASAFTDEKVNAAKEITFAAAPNGTDFTFPGGSKDPGEFPLNNAGSFYMAAEDHSWSFAIDSFDLSFAQMKSLATKGKLFSTMFARDDQVSLVAGNDVFNAYGGDDTIDDSGGSNTIHGGGGDDKIDAYTQVGTKAGHNELYGDSGNDSVTGGNGSDYLDGGTGADTLTGNLGNDTYIVDNIKDKVLEFFADGGKDTVLSSVSYALAARVENLTLTGAGNIHATGNELNNSLTGNKGNNIIDGGAGKDLLKGGAGADRFVFDDGDTAKTKADADTILDFSSRQKDVLDLSRIDAIAKTAKDDDFNFIGKAAFDHHAGELRYVREAGDTLIYGDTNGDGKADFAIHLDGSFDLKEANFDI